MLGNRREFVAIERRYSTLWSNAPLEFAAARFA
jgi:hypothetical protein